MISLGNEEAVTGKGIRRLLKEFLDLIHQAVYFDLCTFLYVMFKYVCYTLIL